MKKSLLLILVVLVLALGISLYLLVQKQAPLSGKVTTEVPTDSGQVTKEIPDTGKVIGNGGSNEHKTYYIDIRDFAYTYPELTIKSGDTVVWTNYDIISHTVTSDSGDELDSPSIAKEETYSHTFTVAGTYDYHCKPHPYMKGKIIVK